VQFNPASGQLNYLLGGAQTVGDQGLSLSIGFGCGGWMQRWSEVFFEFLLCLAQTSPMEGVVILE
jgi:hypothetical protein